MEADDHDDWRSLLAHRRLRAPRRHGEVLAIPDAATIGDWLAGPNPNPTRQRVATTDHAAPRCWASALHELRREARREVLSVAIEHTRRYRDLPAIPSTDSPWILGGHQPLLFHPGVWFKNFVLSELGDRHRAVAINLIVDSDLWPGDTIRVPSAPPRVHWQSVPIDLVAPEQGVPCEERRVVDESLVDTFGARAASAVAPLVPAPLVARLWPHVVDSRRRGAPLPRAIAEGRHSLEGQLGLRTWEAPLGEVCRTQSFCRFATRVLEDIGGFAELLNRSLAEFRSLHGIRSRAHPAPDLERDGEWWEAPFWIWHADSPRRRRLFVSRRDDMLVVTDRDRWRQELGREPSAALHELQQGTVRVRSRALTTTLFFRGVVGDLFVHGIGGAKYDQVTDALLAQWLGIEPPGYLTTTLTAQLVPADLEQRHREVRAVERQLRDLQWNPHLAAAAGAGAELAAERLACVRSGMPGAERHRRIQSLNAALQPHVESLRQHLVSERERLADELADQQKLASRELSFCLFDDESLPTLLRNSVARLA